jgi:hypothetical protein
MHSDKGMKEVIYNLQHCVINTTISARSLTHVVTVCVEIAACTIDTMSVVLF